MDLSQKNDSIAAVATGLGDSGIGIVRISGPDALAVADKIFSAKDGRKVSKYKTYSLHYGWITADGGIVDEVLLTVMRSPRSYTKEDVVEINCHGGIVAMRRILDLVLENGCRLSRPGEFTMRAFLNGRIDLPQAEAVADIIRAKSDAALKLASEQLKGFLSAAINKMRRKLLDTLAHIEAQIDFPEEEISYMEAAHLKQKLLAVDKELKDMLGSSRRGQILREGVQAVICGRPNVGKSSLLNALLKKERCIVTAIEGTTRDAIEEIVDIKGVPVRIVDTAGIIEPRDLVEKKAVACAREYVDKADLAILVFDGSKKLSGQDQALIKRLKKKTVIAVINKIDLKQKIDKDKILNNFAHCVAISAKKSTRIDLLEETIAETVFSGSSGVSGSATVSSRRHIESLKKAEKSIAEALASLDNKLSPEFVAEGVKEALAALDVIVGKAFSAELLDKIFGSFCIGK